MNAVDERHNAVQRHEAAKSNHSKSDRTFFRQTVDYSEHTHKNQRSRRAKMSLIQADGPPSRVQHRDWQNTDDVEAGDDLSEFVKLRAHLISPERVPNDHVRESCHRQKEPCNRRLVWQRRPSRVEQSPLAQVAPGNARAQGSRHRKKNIRKLKWPSRTARSGGSAGEPDRLQQPTRDDSADRTGDHPSRDPTETHENRD